MKLLREDVIQNFRDAVLFALDQCAVMSFRGAKLPKNSEGSTDEDLPELFKTIDAQAERLAARYGIELLDEEKS